LWGGHFARLFFIFILTFLIFVIGLLAGEFPIGSKATLGDFGVWFQFHAFLLIGLLFFRLLPPAALCLRLFGISVFVALFLKEPAHCPPYLAISPSDPFFP